MPTENQNFVLWAGAARLLTIAVVDDDGRPMILDGYTANWKLGRTPDATGANVLIDKDIVGLTGSTIEVPLHTEDTAELEASVCYHSVWVTDVLGDSYPVAIGTAVVRRGMPPD